MYAVILGKHCLIGAGSVVTKKKNMKCVICKSDDIELKKVDEEIKFENDIILVPIEVLVCNNCGERYYEKKQSIIQPFTQSL